MADTYADVAMAFKYSGRRILISEKCANKDMDLDDFKELDYTEIGNTGEIGEIGYDGDFDGYEMLARNTETKVKNVSLADTEVTVARNDQDQGQRYMRMAGLDKNCNNYAFKVENTDGSVDWLRAPVNGPTNQGGGKDDFDEDQYTLGVNQWIHELGDEDGGGCEEYCDLSKLADQNDDEVYQLPDRETVTGDEPDGGDS